MLLHELAMLSIFYHVLTAGKFIELFLENRSYLSQNSNHADKSLLITTFKENCLRCKVAFLVRETNIQIML